jgi:hypothetical protein
VKYPTEYRTEKFYPSYYNERRPQPRGLLDQLTYGGSAFDVLLDSEDLFGDVRNVANATVVVLRPGYSTHSMVTLVRIRVLATLMKKSPAEHGPTHGRSGLYVHCVQQ